MSLNTPKLAVYQFEVNPELKVAGTINVRGTNQGVEVSLTVPIKLVSAPEGSAAKTSEAAGSAGQGDQGKGKSQDLEAFKANLAVGREYTIDDKVFVVDKVTKKGVVELHNADDDTDEIELKVEDLFKKAV
jgi:hypothetical protein